LAVDETSFLKKGRVSWGGKTILWTDRADRNCQVVCFSLHQLEGTELD